MKAQKIWDNRVPELVIVPPDMGAPREDQLRGTGYERLCELAGRVCYDSLGQGRDSEAYHAHILEVGHLSVYEHATFCVRIEPGHNGSLTSVAFTLLRDLVNKPCIHLTEAKGAYYLRLNLRHVLEWQADSPLYNGLRKIGQKIAPMVVQGAGYPNSFAIIKLVRPDSDFQVWKSMYIQTSRNVSMEHIRHGDNTAISQRSTRYVDEHLSKFEEHPVLKLLSKPERERIDSIHYSAQANYYETLQALEAVGVARKQARGAARGVLGGALRTEYIFGASEHQWGHMMDMRANPAADDEIHELFGKHLRREL